MNNQGPTNIIKQSSEELDSGFEVIDEMAVQKPHKEKTKQKQKLK